MPGYLRPVSHQGGVSTYVAHTRRTRPSKEPGVDFYCPIGSHVYAVWSGKVVAVGGGIVPATGRYVTIDLDDGNRVRYLHLSKQSVRAGQRVKRGDVIGLSGASGYGSEFFGASSLSRIPSNTGGPHVHVTLWPGHWQRFGATTSGTIDIQQHISGPQLAGETSRPVTTPSKPAVAPEEEEDEMKNSGVYYEPSKGSVTYLLFNTGSGWFHEFSNGAGNGPMPGDYNNALAGTLGTGSWAKVTPGHAAVIKASLDAVRAQSKS